VFVVVFLFFSGYLTFKDGFFEARQADMVAFFMNLPLLFVFLVPAAAMRLWAEEKKTGSIELLFTLPITVRQAVMGKFMAAWLFLTVALALTFPMVITVCWLGNPDVGLIVVGYIASILMAGGFLAVGCFFSAISNNQVISFVLSVVACSILVFAGMPTTMNYLSTFLPNTAVNAISKMSFQQHFESIQMGVLQFKDIAYFVILIAGWAAACGVVLDEMGKTTRKIMGAACVLIIMFSFIGISQNIGKNWKADVTQQKIYSLSNGTKAILGKLNQPVKMKLYYSKTAAMKGPDQIRFFNNYYEFVKSLLEEYQSASKGMVQLEIIDPRPYSDDEVAAIRYGLKKFPITEEESFFFGLVVQTQFGIEKTIPVFAPARQNFVEYDISYLIDTAITRQKKRVGILSSLNVVGDDVTPYMARMMQMQGQQPSQPWGIATQLKQQYDVKKIETDVNKIEDVDVLLVIHPKDLPEQTLFAIDQFILGGGRTIVCVDPYCIVDLPPQQMMQMQGEHDPSSQLDKLMVNWGLEMPKNTFAGDRSLALEASLRQGDTPQKIIGYLETTADCFNQNIAITAELNQVQFLFSGVLKELPMSDAEKKETNIERTPLVMTTKQGNSWMVNSQLEMMTPDMGSLMKKFTDGTEPVKMAYLVTGKLKSAFPKGIDIETNKPADVNDPNGPKKTLHIGGIAQAKENCAVAVFADVDFMSDILAYRNSFFGTMIVGDNSAMLVNTIDDLCGSDELISIRSRGNFRRPFVVVDQIETQADAQTAEQESKINAEIEGFQNELKTILSSAQQGQEEVIGSSILQKRKELELKIVEAKKQLQGIKKVKLQRKEALGNKLRNFNMLAAPAVILAIAIILGVYRSTRKRSCVSHASDA